MTVLMVTNDDGIDSPALVPLIRALERIESVRKVNAVVPDRERSWISKAITRFDEIEVATAAPRHEDHPPILTANAFPADCANLGLHSLFPERADVLISGINVGLNHGLAFFMASGTVGAATEGWVAGVPAVAFSIGSAGNHGRWVDFAWSPEAATMWERAAAVACDIVANLLEAGFPAEVDLFNVNFPSDVTLETRRVVTDIARVGYDELYARRDSGAWAHDYRGFVERGTTAGASDLDTLRDGHVSITPVQLPHAAEIDDCVRERLER